jgi:hypothetical protein
MNYVARNFFDIVEPQAYSCSVSSYQYSHSLLLVRADRFDSQFKDTLYLAFGDVRYFDGPLLWDGADFCVAAASECAELLRKFRVGLPDALPEMPDDFLNSLLRIFRLYCVETPSHRIRILAGVANKTKDISPNFYRPVQEDE